MKKLLLTIGISLASVTMLSAQPTGWAKAMINSTIEMAGPTVTQEQKDKLEKLFIEFANDGLKKEGKEKQEALKVLYATINSLLTQEQRELRWAALIKIRDEKAKQTTN